MEWVRDLQPIATIVSAIIAGYAIWRLQDKKRNDDIDSKAFEYSLTKKLEEFKTSLIENNSYLSEKGKGLATKEDIEEITRKVESIKNEFVTPIEILRWHLSKKANLHKLQAEKEFEVYSKIWECIADLKFASEGLRPIMDIIDSNESEEAKWNRRYKKIRDKYSTLFTEIEKQRPFYPNELYLQLHHLLRATWKEIVDFESSLRWNEGRMSPEAYQRSGKNLEDIINNLNIVCDLMRTRITES
jgi:hypothetical protein